MSSVDPSRQFVVGETVHIGIRVSKPGTKTPVDPASVELHTLKRDGGAQTFGNSSFTKVAEGDYTYVIHTTDLQPGAYTLSVMVADGADAVVLVADQFVLNPAP